MAQQDDKSPTLGGQNSPNTTGQEPVLKGIYSRIIIERERAYLAGNLKALVSMMSDSQLIRFRHWCLRVSLHQQATKQSPELEDANSLLKNFPDTIEAQLEALDTIGLLALKSALQVHQTQAARWAARALANLTNWDVVWVSASEAGPALATTTDTEQASAIRAQLRAAYLILLSGERRVQ